MSGKHMQCLAVCPCLCFLPYTHCVGAPLCIYFAISSPQLLCQYIQSSWSKLCVILSLGSVQEMRTGFFCLIFLH